MDQATRGIFTVARSVLEQLNTDVVLERVLDAARDLTGARYATLEVLDESQRELGRLMTPGIDPDTRRSVGPLPTGRGVLGELSRDRRPRRVPDVGSHAYSYGFPAGHPPAGSFIGVPILIAGEPYGNLYLTEKGDGEAFSDADEESAILLADFAGLAIDHARRYSGSEEKRAELQETVRALDATLQISRALGGQTDLDAILKLVAKRGRALVSARMLVIELLEGSELAIAAGAGELPADLVGQRVPLAHTVASAALRVGATQWLTDQLNRARFQQHGLGHLGLKFDNGLVVPLIFRDRPYGVLVVLDHLGGGFTPEHQRLLESFATSAATAVATAQSAADERGGQRVAAAEAERSRWARELHDETLQALGSLRLMLAGARRSRDPATLGAAVQHGIEQLELDIANLRALITELRPAALDQLGLEPALMALADRVRTSGLDVSAHVELAYERGVHPSRLSPELETGIYRIVQEALTNAVKHGRAQRADVDVAERDDRLTVLVEDDGIGFDPQASTAGFGLLGMRERAGLLGGELSLRSVPGEGTTIAVIFPVSRSLPSALAEIREPASPEPASPRPVPWRE